MDGAAELQVAAERDREPFEFFLLPSQNKQVAEGLGGMLAAAVSGVEDRTRRVLRRNPRGSVMGVAQYDQVGVGAYYPDRISETLPFRGGTRSHIGFADARAAEPM